MATYTVNGSINNGAFNFYVDVVGVTYDLEANLITKFVQTCPYLTVDYVNPNIVNDNIVSDITAVAGRIHSAESSLSSEFSISATNVFEGDIIQQFDMSASFGMTATPTKIIPSAGDLTTAFSQSQTATLISSVNSDLTASLNIPLSLPFGLFVDASTTLTTSIDSTVNADRFEGGFGDFVSRFVLTEESERIEGTNRKFTTAQLNAISSNSTQIVDFVEIIVRYKDITLELADQVPLPPVLRWNSSGRDLAFLDYKGNVHHYKGKNILMRLPSVEYNGMFTKKTVKIEINGLLRYFNTAMQLGYLDYAPVTMGKAIFNYDLGTLSQVGDAVLLMRGHVNSFTLGGTPDKQSTTIEIDSGFYNYDRRVSTRANSVSYQNHLDRLSEWTQLEVYDNDINQLGEKILPSVQWGADVVV